MDKNEKILIVSFFYHTPIDIFRVPIHFFTLWRPSAFGDFRKKHLNARGFAREYLRSCSKDQKMRQVF